MNVLEIDKLLGCLSSDYPRNQERADFINQEIFGKSDSEIMNYLTELKPEEVGGLTAISGFYYQFLVTIEYFIELLDGKWDFVGFELHDDIVVANEKEKKIRYIQVKTSKKSSQNPSGVTDLYTGSLKTKKGTKEKYRLKDSWVDKLISKARFFKSEDGFKSEFQIYTSYHIVKTDNYNFDNYTDNIGYEKKISKSDSLLKVVLKNTHNADFKQVEYKDLCGEPLEELLARLYIKTGNYMSDVKMFVNDLIVELSKRVFKDYKNISLDIKDIHLLIGMLCSRCMVNGEAKYLKVTRPELEDILSELREKCLKNVEVMNEEHSNKKTIERILGNYLGEIEGTNLYSKIEDRAYVYREYLYEWFEQDGNVRDLYNRYVDGTIRSQYYYKVNQQTRETTLQNLFSITILLNIIFNETLLFGENKYFLTKKLNRHGAEPVKLYSILSTGRSYNLEKSINKINLILESADESEHLYLLDKQLSIILQNYTDRSFNKSQHKELSTKINLENVEGIDESSDFNNVSINSLIIPGKIIDEQWFEFLALDDFQKFIEELIELWSELVDG